jgi:hypothetical protein
VRWCFRAVGAADATREFEGGGWRCRRAVRSGRVISFADGIPAMRCACGVALAFVRQLQVCHLISQPKIAATKRVTHVAHMMSEVVDFFSTLAIDALGLYANFACLKRGAHPRCHRHRCMVGRLVPAVEAPNYRPALVSPSMWGLESLTSSASCPTTIKAWIFR